jgi:hypothetical protein
MVSVTIRIKPQQETGETDLKAIERIFHPLGRTVDVHCMRRPARSDMMQWIKRFQPHVFHFAGHGRKVAGAEHYGLRIESDDGGWTWTSDAIDVDLPRERWVPKFVFLNACRSAAEQSGSWSTHRSFLAAGATAVLACRRTSAAISPGNLLPHCTRAWLTAPTWKTPWIERARPFLVPVCTENLKSDYNGDEVRQGWRVNE